MSIHPLPIGGSCSGAIGHVSCRVDDAYTYSPWVVMPGGGLESHLAFSVRPGLAADDPGGGFGWTDPRITRWRWHGEPRHRWYGEPRHRWTGSGIDPPDPTVILTGSKRVILGTIASRDFGSFGGFNA